MSELNNWSAVDEAIRRVGEIDIALERINGDATELINDIRDQAKRRASGLADEKKALEQAIRGFCEVNKGEFAKRRTKRLTFGEVAYRLTSSVAIPRLKDKVAALVEALRAYGCMECIQVTERPDRDRITELDDATIAKLGLTRTVRDSFRIVPDRESIEKEAA